MITSENLLLAIAVVLLTGLAFSKLCKLLHIPNVTGYLVGGLLIGPGLLGLINGFDGILGVSAVTAMKVIVDIELAFIAFTIGLSFRKDYLKKIGPKPIIMAFCESFAAVVIITGVLLCFTPILIANIESLKTFKDVFAFSLALGSIGAATAPAATLMVIKQYKARGKLTDTLVAVVAVDDASALIFFGIAMAVVEILGGQGTNVALSVALPFIEIIISIVIGIIFGAALCLLIHYFHGRGTRIACTVACILAAAGLVSLLNTVWRDINMNISDLFAVMILGAVFTNFTPERDEMQVNDLFERFTPPFVIMFFVLSGAELDFANFMDTKILLVLVICILVYILCRTIGKYVGVRVSGSITKMDKTVSNYLALGLMPQGGVALGLSVMVGRLPTFQNADGTLGILGVIIQTTIIASCFITELFGPLFTKYILYKSGEADLSLK